MCSFCLKSYETYIYGYMVNFWLAMLQVNQSLTKKWIVYFSMEFLYNKYSKFMRIMVFNKRFRQTIKIMLYHIDLVLVCFFLPPSFLLCQLGILVWDFIVLCSTAIFVETIFWIKLASLFYKKVKVCCSLRT